MKIHSAIRITLPTLLLACCAVADEKASIIHENPYETVFPSGGRLRMDLCPSGVEIRGTEDNKLQISYDSKNGDDTKVKVKLNISGNLGRLAMDDCPRNNFQITIKVPSITNLYVRMWAGELDIKGVTGDKDMELHAGELNVNIGKPEDYAHVDASVITGEVNAAPFDVSKGGLFRSFKKHGPGKYRLHAHVGAGQVDLN
jgi:hypothetical protein